MSRRYLLSTPAGLECLQRRQPPIGIQGPHGFISTEAVFLDARSAHELQAVTKSLFQAAARIYGESRAPKGRLSKDGLADLHAALIRAREWM